MSDSVDGAGVLFWAMGGGCCAPAASAGSKLRAVLKWLNDTCFSKGAGEEMLEVLCYQVRFQMQGSRYFLGQWLSEALAARY